MHINIEVTFLPQEPTAAQTQTLSTYQTRKKVWIFFQFSFSCTYFTNLFCLSGNLWLTPRVERISFIRIVCKCWIIFISSFPSFFPHCSDHSWNLLGEFMLSIQVLINIFRNVFLDNRNLSCKCTSILDFTLG